MLNKKELVSSADSIFLTITTVGWKEKLLFPISVALDVSSSENFNELFKVSGSANVKLWPEQLRNWIEAFGWICIKLCFSLVAHFVHVLLKKL